MAIIHAIINADSLSTVYYVAGIIITILVLAYLIYVLIKPEKF